MLHPRYYIAYTHMLDQKNILTEFMFFAIKKKLCDLLVLQTDSHIHTFKHLIDKTLYKGLPKTKKKHGNGTHSF